MKLRTTLALITAAVGITALNAQAQSTSEWEGTADVRYVSRNIFRGDKQTGQSMQANVEFNPVAGKDGFFVGGWANQPFSAKRKFEFDLYGGYRYNYAGFQFSGGVTGYFYPQSSSGETDYTYEFFLSAQREILKNWGVMATAYYDMRRKDLTGEIATGYRIPYRIEKFQASIDLSAFAGASAVRDALPDAPAPFTKIKDNFTYYGLTASTTVWLTRNVRASIGLQYGDTNNKSAARPYGSDGGDNLYGYASIGLKW